MIHVGDCRQVLATMPAPRLFPVMVSRGYGMRGPVKVPWALLTPHEVRAKSNHGGQSLERLAERGGLCMSEVVAVLEDRPWVRMADEAALARLLELGATRDH